MAQADRGHLRLEALLQLVAGRLGRQDLRQRRAIEAELAGELRPRRDQQRAAFLHILDDVAGNSRADRMPSCEPVEDDQVEFACSLILEQLATGKAISASSWIGVKSCFSGGRRMVKWIRSTDGIGLEQVAPGALARMRLAGDQQHPQPVAHAVDRERPRGCWRASARWPDFDLDLEQRWRRHADVERQLAARRPASMPESPAVAADATCVTGAGAAAAGRRPGT